MGRRGMGTALLGWFPIGDEFLQVLWREVPTPAGQELTLSIPDAKPLGAEPTPGSSVAMMLWLFDENGTPVLLTGRFDEDSSERFRERWNEVHGS